MEDVADKGNISRIPYYAWANRQATSMQVWNLSLGHSRSKPLRCAALPREAQQG